ncbi:unnamed protein product [Symbiodinium natans]|uniref:Chromatin target of PRMT1 protein C-terminal domain-containing protein n=1 Tax=Symbiodinium natans TaxID=878477 RepID=A0A812PR75_9DINO|nr:unnamed protein product [Symbiodinium natans]
MPENSPHVTGARPRRSLGEVFRALVIKRQKGGYGYGSGYGRGRYGYGRGRYGRGSYGRGKGRGYKGGRKGKGKGKGKGKRNQVTKEMLDRQLEEYMGPDAMKAMLDLELEAYFKDKKSLEAPKVESAAGNP